MLSALKKLVYPPKCIACTHLLDDKDPHEYVCPACYHHILKEHICPVCGRPYSLDGTSCAYCDQLSEEITQVIALYPYKDVYKRSVFRWKYKGVRKYAKGFAQLLEQEKEILKTLEIDALIPVPVSARRYRERGFNQAYDLAEQLGERLNVPVHDILMRHRHTKPQSACTKAERAKNIRKTIRISDVPYDIIDNGKKINIAIIDDIYTTGSTIKECLRALSESQMLCIDKVYVVVVCIGT